MIRLEFACEFKTDIILHSSAATEGNNSSLDFIPGSAFLGILAKGYKDFGDDAFGLFHSGKVKFSDGHLLNPESNERSLIVPSTFYQLKGSDFSSNSSAKNLLHSTPEEIKDDICQGNQWKQVRNKYASFSKDSLSGVAADKSLRLKSAWDRKLRKTKSGQIFAYESLAKGLKWGFYIEIDNDLNTLKDQILNGITGVKQLGKSKTAEYGLVEIFYIKMYEYPKSNISQTSEVFLYLEGPVALVNEYGYPKIDPEPTDFGITGELVREKSKILSRNYAPYNGKRKTRDAERICIDKGSVLVFEKVTSIALDKIEQGIGLYLSEGFGKVILNPEFLLRKEYTIKSLVKESVSKQNVSSPAFNDIPTGSLLLDYLLRKAETEKTKSEILDSVDQFIQDFYGSTYSKTTPSQWGGIRERAKRAKSANELLDLLFGIHKEGNQNIERGYLTHGVSSEVWLERNRIGILSKWIKDQGFNSCEATIVLASAMAKELSKKS